jgi:hypothetical protein
VGVEMQWFLGQTFDLQEKLDNIPNNKLTRNLLASHMYKEYRTVLEKVWRRETLEPGLPRKRKSQILPTPKDKLPLFQSEGIYKVECLCGKCYIGQTGRSIQCRLKEHSRAIKQYDKEKSALAEHKFEDGDHTFDLEKTVVLAKTTKYHQRLIREAIEIRKYPNNFKRDTE